MYPSADGPEQIQPPLESLLGPDVLQSPAQGRSDRSYVAGPNTDEMAKTEKFGQILEAFQAAIEAGDPVEEDRVSIEALALAAEWADENPSPDLQLKMKAHACESAADWAGAEAAYREALSLAEASQEWWNVYKAHADLRALHGLLDQKAEALREARLALEAARREGLDTLLAMALRELAASLLQSGEVSEAREAVEEVLRITPAGRMYDHQRAQALIFRARCHVEVADLHGAEEDIDQAMTLLAPQASMMLAAGVQSALASAWAVKARIHRQRGDLPGAADAWEKNVEYRRRVAAAPQLAGPYAHNSLSDALRKYGEALLEVGRAESAEHALEESRALRRAIGLPESDPR